VSFLNDSLENFHGQLTESFSLTAIEIYFSMQMLPRCKELYNLYVYTASNLASKRGEKEISVDVL